MPVVYTIDRYTLALYNTRNDHGALRALRLWTGEEAVATLWFIAGEPRPSVKKRDEEAEWDVGIWDVRFPLQNFEVLLDVLRNEHPLWLIVDPPERASIVTELPPEGG